MERLDTIIANERSPLEAALHLARYATALPYARGARVLDIACGEGYGSSLLHQAGAVSVDGLDVSAEAIGTARQHYGRDGICFHHHTAETLTELFPDDHFSLVVSYETIEHLTNPTAFLREIRRVAAPDATLVISCPNDHWYFKNPGESNPFHIRKYTFEEFQQLTEAVLGPASRWALGGPIFGYGTTAWSPPLAYPRLSDCSWMSCRAADSALVVPGIPDAGYSPIQSIYYVGYWGPQEPIETSLAVFPASLDLIKAADMTVNANLPDVRARELQAIVSRLDGVQASIEALGDFCVYGAGSVARVIGPAFAERVVGVFDNNPSLRGTTVLGKPVRPVSELASFQAHPVVVTPIGRKAQIAPVLTGHRGQVIFVEDLF